MLFSIPTTFRLDLYSLSYRPDINFKVCFCIAPVLGHLTDKIARELSLSLHGSVEHHSHQHLCQ